MLYLYIVSLTRIDFKFKKAHLSHLIPFALSIIFLLFKFCLYNADLLREMLRRGNYFISPEFWILQFLGDIQFLIYIIASLIALKKYRTRIKNIFSTIENINLSWLSFIIYGFIGYKSLKIIEQVVWLVTGSDIVMILYIMAEIALLIFISLIVIKGLKQPVIFSEYVKNQSRQKYERTLLSDEMKEEYKKRLILYMEKEKPYLNPLLSLNDLAELVSIPPYHLSQVLNTSINKNFFDFVNYYRIEESKKLLLQLNANKKTVLEILYQTGFNSKSVFNNAFKKYTGLTPTEFRDIKTPRDTTIS